MHLLPKDELGVETPESIDDLAEEVRLVKAFRDLPKDRQLNALKLIEALKWNVLPNYRCPA